MMRSLYLILALTAFQVMHAGNGYHDPAPGRCLFGISGGLSFSANDFSKENDDLKMGVYGKLHFPTCGFTSYVLEYNSLFKFDLNAAFADVKARDYDGNVYFGGQFQGTPSSFFAFTGLCVKTWEATYTGIGENRITGTFVPVGTRAKLIRFCANLGLGMERKINDLSLTGDIRFRISPVKENVKVEIMDLMYSVGLKLNFVYRKKDNNKRKWFKLPNNIYDLD